MNLQLTDLRALVTGASAGIGFGIARILALEGCRLSIVARNEDALERAADAIAADGCARPAALVQDVTAADSAPRLFQAVESAFGGLDILVNNAGASRAAPIGTPEEDWAEAMELNWGAVRRISEAFIPGMIERKWGRIVNITGTMEPLGINAGTCAKAAVQAWSKGLSRDHAADGLTVNCVVPGRIRSAQSRRNYPGNREAAFAATHIPAGHFGEPEDIGNLVAFLASPKARYISGSVVPVDGGMKRFAH